jgi:MoxR-like ATPase
MAQPQDSSSLAAVIAAAGDIILGKERQLRLALACLLARGHLLIEDLPGVGKTTLAHTLARLLGLDFQRIQFTSDMLPADILGISVFDRERGEFRFHPGPIFTQVVLADEINRATPKAQSALLEAMEERQVTLEGATRRLPEPFFVIATQNPAHQIGTFPLPESQLDRFLMRIQIGYPDAAEEKKILERPQGLHPAEELQPVLSVQDVLDLQHAVEKVRVDDSLADYLLAIVAATRRSPLLGLGISTRGAMALHKAAKARALLRDRDYCLPDDIKELAPVVLSHRVMAQAGQAGAWSPGRRFEEAERVIREIVASIAVPL